MQKEVDSINARNKAIGSAFVGIAAGLATASGLYSALDEDPNPAVTASLSIGAGGTTVPSFFFFGSDEREKLVLLRITEINDKWETFEKAWNDFQEADRQVAIKRNDLNIEETKKHNIDCNDSPDECQKIDIQIIMLEKVQADTYSKWFAASHAAIQAAEELDRICQ